MDVDPSPLTLVADGMDGRRPALERPVSGADDRLTAGSRSIHSGRMSPRRPSGGRLAEEGESARANAWGETHEGARRTFSSDDRVDPASHTPRMYREFRAAAQHGCDVVGPYDL
jgi:hypothetical protein